MNDRLEAFNRLINKKRIAVLGIGVSNTPLIKQFLKSGAIVIACDRRTRDKLGTIADKPVADELEEAGAILQLGDDYLNNLDADIIFRTPGMKYNLPQLEAARKKGIAVTSEMEVFFDLCPCKIFAVTGSDGKTTTTTIISEMFKKQGYTVHLGGNIGHPLLPDIEQINVQDMAVVELSSFQLISMRKSPHIAVVTNLSPNHLDMHKDMDEYINAKKNIFIHQNAFCRTVLNLDNAITSSFADETRGQCYMFSRKAAVPYGSFLRDDGVICMNDGNIIHEIMRADEINIPGVHNIENYLAAISAVWGYVSPENMCSVAKAFTGVEHRIEFVKEIDGVKYYNDSIATTPTRTIAGLYSFNQKVILIAGGYDKHIPFAILGPKVMEKVKILILLGKTAEKIEEAVKADNGYNPELLPIIKVTSLQEAVETAKQYATVGDVVTLSPACASFDMYKNFEERGKVFKEIVNLLHNA